MDPASGDGSPNLPPATCSNGSSWGKTRYWPSQGDLTIPFDNHQAERDLRLLKVQQKISDCFRAPRGSAAFARVRSSLSTLRKQGVALLAALQTRFTGQPLYPACA